MKSKLSRIKRLMFLSSRGLEYNTINPNRKVSYNKWFVDIASNPNLIKDLDSGGFSHINVHAEAKEVNSKNYLVNAYLYLVEGR